MLRGVGGAGLGTVIEGRSVGVVQVTRLWVEKGLVGVLDRLEFRMGAFRVI
jgi:hypothetical protein